MDILTGHVQQYSWGHPTAIADIQHRTPTGTVEAELWLGAHPALPSILGRSRTPLDREIAADPLGTLGPAVDAEFGGLPFLVKILAAAQPLSIQTHPNKAQAEAGFEREQALGVAIDSPVRTYRDPNHKPELICAVGVFEAKCGFRQLGQSHSIIRALEHSAGALGDQHGSALSEMADRLEHGAATQSENLTGCLEWLYSLDTHQSAQLVEGLRSGAQRLVEVGSMPSLSMADSIDYEPVIEWTIRLADMYPDDPGVGVALLLNHVVLQPGEAMFLGAGIPHSYLGGVGVEVMANSDNVVRGGLTPKHVDTRELARVVDPTPHSPLIQTSGPGNHQFSTPCPDFCLNRIEGAADHIVTPDGPEIVLVTNGQARLSTTSPQGQQQVVVVGSGQAAFVAYRDGPYRIATADGALVWRAGAGL